jgi:hypothetical protein
MRANGPIHVTASTREGELAALRKRGADQSSDDETSFVEDEPDRVEADRRRIDESTSRHDRPSSPSLERPCARGPPIV